MCLPHGYLLGKWAAHLSCWEHFTATDPPAEQASNPACFYGRQRLQEKWGCILDRKENIYPFPWTMTHGSDLLHFLWMWNTPCLVSSILSSVIDVSGYKMMGLLKTYSSKTDWKRSKSNFIKWFASLIKTLQVRESEKEAFNGPANESVHPKSSISVGAELMWSFRSTSNTDC